MTHDTYPTDEPAVVTCGLPYANGDLHIGHFRTYVGGDVYARALETLGQQTAFVCGSDMHGTPVAVDAKQNDEDPETLALDYYREHKALFPEFNVEFDEYGHTRQPTNIEITTQIVQTLEERGYIDEREATVAYDPEADQTLPDRYVEGTCPYCGSKARGDECDEGCGRHLEPGEIENPVSTITGNEAEYREQTHKFFRLSDLQEYLQAFIERLEGTDNAKHQPREWIFGELEDWCITRDIDWGVDYPGELPDGQDRLVLYVWVDAHIEYISATKQYTERAGAAEYDWKSAWKDDGEIIHIIGRDIIQHHTVFWPSVLHATDYNEPRAVLASGFMTLDGKGFSKSRGRAIWAREYLDEGFHPDLLRYYLMTTGGFQQDVDFSWEKFSEKVNNDLVGTLGNFLYRSLLFAHRNFGGTPKADPSETVTARIEDAIEAFNTAVNEYTVREIGTIAVTLARFGNEYIQNNEPWALTDSDPERAAQVIRDCVQLVKAIAVLLEPVAPEKSQALWKQLNEDGSVHDQTVQAALDPPSREFDAPTELFETLEDERVEQLNAKLDKRVQEVSGDAAASSEANGNELAEVEPLTDERVSMETFETIDLRTGEVQSADPIAESDHLVKLMVDIGHETRQIVAGIKQSHDIEALPGTQVVIVANLEPATIMDHESNGMLLAAGEQADLLTTTEDTQPGTKIR
ncbi:methionine--tRNA ligase [Halocatena salina]|uniref:Methionine--tRNA ligase n=1 Tax=Halocatena salina TaxID=2934340 RepID=A0A8U0A800_9EURY|nr:methionine--tRNA ligase [Halocatena salina]UPM45321.1 methionine--tRNA ligase [Halocatena salina]